METKEVSKKRKIMQEINDNAVLADRRKKMYLACKIILSQKAARLCLEQNANIALPDCARKNNSLKKCTWPSEALTTLQSKLEVANQYMVTSSNELRTMRRKLDTTYEDLVSSRTELSILQSKLDRAQQDMEACKTTSNRLTLQNAKLVEEKLSVQRTLEDEKKRLECQICMDKPRDTLCLPCSHFLYCFACLSRHQKESRTKTCPACRGHVSGLLKCIL